MMNDRLNLLCLSLSLGILIFQLNLVNLCQPQNQSRQQLDYNHEKAIAILKGYFNNTQISGIIKFNQPSPNEPILISLNISGLPKGQGNLKHGIHIHAFGTSVASDDVAISCGSSGAHFDPSNITHGDIKSSKRHLGDYGNVISDNNGRILTQFYDNVTTLFGPLSVVGRNIVLHQLEDDLGLKDNLGSQTIGNSGIRIACGIIGIGNF